MRGIGPLPAGSARRRPGGAAGQRVALAAWRALGCRDGGRLDFRCDKEGQPHFLEANPLPGLHPQHSDLPILCGFAGIPYVNLIDRIVRSARRRIGVFEN